MAKALPVWERSTAFLRNRAARSAGGAAGDGTRPATAPPPGKKLGKCGE